MNFGNNIGIKAARKQIAAILEDIAGAFYVQNVENSILLVIIIECNLT